MFSTKAVSLRALSRAPRCPTARRWYATEYDQRTKETLKTSSRLTWLTTTAAIGAAALYYTTSSSSPTPSSSQNTTTTSSSSSSSHTSTSSPPDPTKPGHRHESEYADDVPKPVEDRHGDTVLKHSIAAHKNQNRVREGKFSGKEFDNHVQKHSPGRPDGDFEKRD